MTTSAITKVETPKITGATHGVTPSRPRLAPLVFGVTTAVMAFVGLRLGRAATVRPT